MATEPDAVARPVFGPSMSRTIFQKKWLCKFHAVLTETTPYFDPHQAINVLSKQYLHFLQFNSQAKELGLDERTFTKELAETTEPVAEPDDPFVLGAKIMMGVDWLLCRYQDMKDGFTFAGYKWQELPLAVRQQVDDALARRTKAEELGWWPISEDMRDEMEELVENDTE
ncbi:hypothetical protein PRZ48_013552 [Zasmidium cellare]|uniref:Uncharacterized protein n=1 Tax=Zasmidium cellare TaxID=395010 RepID=A0ABR0E249_ZASCE|nr:hypothetical protein PRZ48_013552 [Zasmidium cellare]